MRRASIAAACVFGLLAAGCSAEEPAPQAAARQEAATEIPPTIAPYDPAIDPSDFVETIDNPYMPLEPGTTLVYEGRSDGETEVITVTVTDRTKEVMGVTTRVVRDTVRIDGKLFEDTFDWFAQDRFGTVWYFGEATKEFEDGKVSTAGSWEAGVDGALPGIVMLAQPEVGAKYRQEYYVGEAEDMGRVLELDATTDVAYGSFEDVIVTKDWTPLEPKIAEHKFYAPAVGMVREEAVKGGSGVVELVEMKVKGS